MEVFIIIGILTGIPACALILELKNDLDRFIGFGSILLIMICLILMGIPIRELSELKKQVENRHKGDIYNSAYILGKEDALKKKPYINQYHEQKKSQEEITGYSNGYAENYQP